jgi:ankyrin repeat protein
MRVQNRRLLESAESGDASGVRRALNWGADLDASLADGSTALHCAAREGHTEVCILLLGEGADVTAADESGATPLHVAARYQPVTGALIVAGADVASRSRAGRTPLHMAVLFDGYAAAKFLIGRGADVDAADALGATPLHVAAEQGALQMARLLIEAGADVNVRRTPVGPASGSGVGGESPVDLARAENHTEVVALLREAGASG